MYEKLTLQKIFYHVNNVDRALRNKVTFVCALNLYETLKLSRGGYARITLYAKIACDIMQSRRRKSRRLCLHISLIFFITSLC